MGLNINVIERSPEYQGQRDYISEKNDNLLSKVIDLAVRFFSHPFDSIYYLFVASPETRLLKAVVLNDPESIPKLLNPKELQRPAICGISYCNQNPEIGWKCKEKCLLQAIKRQFRECIIALLREDVPLQSNLLEAINKGTLDLSLKEFLLVLDCVEKVYEEAGSNPFLTALQLGILEKRTFKQWQENVSKEPIGSMLQTESPISLAEKYGYAYAKKFIHNIEVGFRNITLGVGIRNITR